MASTIPGHVEHTRVLLEHMALLLEHTGNPKRPYWEMIKGYTGILLLDPWDRFEIYPSSWFGGNMVDDVHGGRKDFWELCDHSIIYLVGGV